MDHIDAMKFDGISQDNTAVVVCGPQTGYAVKNIAFCDTPLTAMLIVDAIKAAVKNMED